MTEVNTLPLWRDRPVARRVDHARSIGCDLESGYVDLAPRLLGYFRANGAPDPEDLLGEVFFQAARDFTQFEGDRSALRRWIFTIARNRLVDTRRRCEARPQIAPTRPPDRPSDATPGPIDPALAAALSRITEDQREVVVLRFVADLSIRDVARVTDRPVGAVKALQHRGLAALQRILAGGGPDRRA